MSRNKQKTREELIAELEALDNSTEVGQLKAKIEELSALNSDLMVKNKALTSSNKELGEALKAIYKVLDPFTASLRGGGGVYRGRIYDEAYRKPNIEAAAATSRSYLAEVQVGVQKGTHDPATGEPYTKETKPLRDLGAGSRAATQAELAKVFPNLSGPTVIASDEEG